MYGLTKRLAHVAILAAPAVMERPPPSIVGSVIKRVDAMFVLGPRPVLSASKSWVNATAANVPVLSRPWHEACVCPQYLVITEEAPAPVPPVI